MKKKIAFIVLTVACLVGTATLFPTKADKNYRAHIVNDCFVCSPWNSGEFCNPATYHGFCW